MGVVIRDDSSELLCFFADDFEGGKVQIETLNEHGLYMIVSLDSKMYTSVTGLSSPFMKDV